MVTEALDVSEVQNAVDEAYQEVVSEDRAAQAEEVAHAVDTPEQDPFAQAAEAIRSRPEPQPEVVDKGYLDDRLASFAESIRGDVATAVREATQSPVIEETPDVKAFEAMLYDGPREPTPEEVAHAKAQFVARRNAAQQVGEESESVSDILKSIQSKIDRLENQRVAPQTQGWSPEEVQHITNAINYAAIGAGLNLDYTDQTQISAVLSGVETGENADSVIRKVTANIQRIGSNVNQTSNPAPSVAASIPSLASAPTAQAELAIETRDDFLEAVADGKIAMSEYPRYASLFA